MPHDFPRCSLENERLADGKALRGNTQIGRDQCPDHDFARLVGKTACRHSHLIVHAQGQRENAAHQSWRWRHAGSGFNLRGEIKLRRCEGLAVRQRDIGRKAQDIQHAKVDRGKLGGFGSLACDKDVEGMTRRTDAVHQTCRERKHEHGHQYGQSDPKRGHRRAGFPAQEAAEVVAERQRHLIHLP